MTEAGNPPKTKTGGFPPSLESAIPPRFPHSHRPGGCYIGFKIQGPKAKPERSLSSAPVSSPFRLILQLEKTRDVLPTTRVTRHPRNSERVKQVGPPLPLMQSSLPGKVRTSNPAWRRRAFVLQFSSMASSRLSPSANTLHANVSRSEGSISTKLKPWT